MRFEDLDVPSRSFVTFPPFSCLLPGAGTLDNNYSMSQPPAGRSLGELPLDMIAEVYEMLDPPSALCLALSSHHFFDVRDEY